MLLCRVSTVLTTWYMVAHFRQHWGSPTSTVESSQTGTRIAIQSKFHVELTLDRPVTLSSLFTIDTRRLHLIQATRYGSSQGTPKMILMYQEWNTLTVESQHFSPPMQNFQRNRKTCVNSFCLVSAQMTRAHIRQRPLLDIIRPPGIFQWRVHTYNCTVYEHFYTHWQVLEALHLYTTDHSQSRVYEHTSGALC